MLRRSRSTKRREGGLAVNGRSIIFDLGDIPLRGLDGRRGDGCDSPEDFGRLARINHSVAYSASSFKQ
jgi:hypothetical protein